MVKYTFRDGSRTKSKDANAVGSELRRIRKARGALTPEAVVEESAPPTAVLHDEFEWDDTAAGRLYREEQARQLIRAVCVIHPAVENLRAYECVVSGDQSQYVPISEVMSDEYLRVQALANAKVDLSGAQHHLKTLLALGKPTSGVRKALKHSNAAIEALK